MVIVVDDGSKDETAAIAAAHGAVGVRPEHTGYAGGARNSGWDEASGDVGVFLDSDAVPAPGWGAGLRRALEEFPGALIGSARTFDARTAWGWVAHLQVETPYLPLGEPRRVRFLSSYCLAVPRGAPLRWDESYGGEDGLFSADAIEAGIPLVFDPRYHAYHDHPRESFSSLRSQQDRLAFGLARIGSVQREGLHKRVLARAPLWARAQGPQPARISARPPVEGVTSELWRSRTRQRHAGAPHHISASQPGRIEARSAPWRGAPPRRCAGRGRGARRGKAALTPPIPEQALGIR